MTGIITGGWGYVIAAYGITALALGIYTVALILRLRQEIRKTT